MESSAQHCPLCGTELSGVKFKEIQTKLDHEEKNKATELRNAETALRMQLEQQFNETFRLERQALEERAKLETERRIQLATAERAEFAKKLRESSLREAEIMKESKAEIDRQKQAAELKARAEAADQIKRLATERDQAAERLKEVEAREAAIKKQAQEELAQERLAFQLEAKLEAERQIQVAAAAREELEKKLRESQLREAEIKKGAQAEIDRQKQAAELGARAEAADQIKKLATELDQAATKARDAEVRESAVRKQLTLEAEKERLKELAIQRQSLENDKKLALLKQQSEFNRERESVQAKLLTMEKQIQKKTANELGDGAEIDLYEALRESFPTDKITRVPKGQPGADIAHEVLYKGESCGRIIIDSKNHQGWQNAFVTKLRQDQVEAQAEHAILSTTVFPAGKKEMCIESGIILISPARVIYVLQLLRNAMVTMHVKGLSIKERATKMSRLYELITSESYSRKLTEAGKLAEEILELDVQEKKAHDNVWKKRGSLAKRAQNVLREAETDVAAVIESIEDGEAPPAYSVRKVDTLTEVSRAQETL